MRTRELATELVRDLSLRVSTHPGPSWPVDILQAERDLSRVFLPDMRDAFDTIGSTAHAVTGATVDPLGNPPTRVVELAYFLLAARHGDLSLGDRRRLAESVAAALQRARPLDPLCRSGSNVLLSPSDADQLAELAQASTEQAGRVLAALRGSLLALAEIVHVGVPQYGREIHGPYPTGRDQFLLVRDYADLRLPDLWPETSALPFDEVRIVEMHRGDPALVRFDLSNHITAAAALHRSPKAVALLSREGKGLVKSADVHSTLDSIADVLARLNAVITGYTEDHWFDRHCRSRYRMLRSCAAAAGGTWEPSPDPRPRPPTEPKRPPPPDYTGLSAADLFDRLISDLGLDCEGAR